MIYCIFWYSKCTCLYILCMFENICVAYKLVYVMYISGITLMFMGTCDLLEHKYMQKCIKLSCKNKGNLP